METPRVNSALIRRINTARVFHALREQPDLSQRSLMELTQLDAATVSTILAHLEADGLVIRASQPRGRPGRPESLLRINPDAGWLCGVELDTAAIRLIAAGMDGAPRQRLEMPGSKRADRAFRRVQDGVTRILAAGGADPARLRGIGIGIPVLIDEADRLVLAPNLKWRDPALPQRLRGLFAQPVQVENVPKAAALAEQVFGACRGVADFLLVHGQSGIGGAFYLRGELYRGVGGLAGEIGHIKIVPGGRRCGCGQLGCLEAYISDRAIRARLTERGIDLPDMAQVTAAAAQGEATVVTVLREAGWHLGLGLATLLNLFNPRRIVIGGNLTQVARFLLPSAQSALAGHALVALRRQCEVVVSQLGNEAVAMGGVAMAMEALLPRPVAHLRQGGGAAGVPALAPDLAADCTIE